MTEGLAKRSDAARRDTARSFVAVPLPAGVRSAILAAVHDAGPASAGGSLATQLPDVRWSRRPENLHITMKFLGQVDRTLLARFVADLAVDLAPVAGFDVDLRGFGAFPSLRDAQVIWVGVDDPAHRLAGVARIVEDVAGRLAVGDDHAHASAKRVFRAHVTVGRTPRRARHGVDATAALGSSASGSASACPWADWPFGRVAVSEVHVYESITGGDASTYVLRGTATLEGATNGDGQDREQGRN